MATLEAVRAHGAVLDDITTMATADLLALVREVQREEAPVARDVLLETVPALADPYASSIGLVAAEFYDQVRVESGVSERYTPEEAQLPEQSRYESLVRWGVSPWFAESSTTEVVSLLAGGLQRVLMGQARETVLANAQRDPVSVRYQRVPSAGCCAFCGMLASRGGDYSSAESASVVGGRGVPVPKVRRRGGQGRGVRARGTQRIGDDFHDYCRCVASPIFGSGSQEMPSFVQDFEDAYGEAATLARKELNEAGSPGFGDSAQHRKMLLSKMRDLTGAA